MNTEVRLERLAQPEAEARLKATRLAVLAPGSVEQHGPHLPLGTDAFAADALAEAIARGLGCAGVQVSAPAHLRDALAWALAADEPALVDVQTALSEAAVSRFRESAQAKAIMGAE